MIPGMSRKISAIDIGSNAIRMMIAELHSGQMFSYKKYRSSVRLGSDVFKQGTISEQTIQQAEEAFVHFAHLNKKFNIDQCRAVATSATREAQNKNELIQRIERKSKIKIDVISGIEEARLIFNAVKNEIVLDNKNAVLIDVGGGSVEVTQVENAKLKVSQSFPLGTVRLLDALSKKKMSENHLKIVLGDHMQSLNHFIQKNFNGQNFEFAIGTGGNLECMARLKLDLLKKSPNSYCTLEELIQISDLLKTIPIKDRISKLKLRPDRADVIVPALLVVKTILRQYGIRKILIPCVGLRDGILWGMQNNN